MIKTTVAFDTYWRFAAERLAMFFRRRSDPIGPWTEDSILKLYRFTNVYRAVDRVSQYLIREVQYGVNRSQAPNEIFFRTMLFKMFNKIETWEALEKAHGPLEWRTANLNAVDCTLNDLRRSGRPIYSAAYIIPPAPFGHSRKHSNHLALLKQMMTDRLPDYLRQAQSLREVYESILAYPGLGKFLAFQLAIDLNYSSLLNFEESSFVVAGPGALDGISKCFSATDGQSAEALIHWVTERQAHEFSSRGIEFRGLFGRPLQPIDCQNLFCEVSKYTRVSHPELSGIANRQRIKQTYKPVQQDLAPLMFPPHWKLEVPPEYPVQRARVPYQAALL